MLNAVKEQLEPKFRADIVYDGPNTARGHKLRDRLAFNSKRRLHSRYMLAVEQLRQQLKFHGFAEIKIR